MGKRDVRVIAVPKGVTVALLIFTTLAMVALFYLLSRHAYLRPAGSTAQLLDRVVAAEQAGRLSVSGFVAALWPVVANILLFMPWGFLAFVALDRPQRPRAATYVIALTGGVLFAVAIQLWQSLLPMRVSSPSDAVANVFGVLSGAIAGNVRKQVRFRSDY